ncbi:MAG: GTP-binding protein [Bacteroidales bacterium]|nr:GTP-binding protein [Bacteroidales bacterium]MBR0028859.1 GTP-binding protein [Bacteroidales bacterium]
METRQLPVLLLTGYLGSGKTTLLNRILANRKGIKFAVIVNDIGEVNIDADLIQKGGIVGQGDDSLVALQNGCICCTLKMDLVNQIADLASTKAFDYIVIEASGICEPAPIANTISTMPNFGVQYTKGAVPYVDCIVTVVDSLRMKDEFAGGDALGREDIGEEDLERLIIEQLEFCNIVLLNKASELTAEELGRLRAIVKGINPGAKVLQCDYGDIDLDEIIYTGMFDFDTVATSAAWIAAIEGEDDEDEAEGEALEYGIDTFVYMRREPLDINKFDNFIFKHWPAGIIRAKGVCYFATEPGQCYLFEQAGRQKLVRDAGLWYATMDEYELEQQMARDPQLRRDWDPVYGDRMQKIVFIGQNLDKQEITRLMDECLAV